MARNKGPRKVQQCGVAGSSFLDDHAFRKPLARTFVATTAQTFVRRRANARPASTNTPRHEHHLTECQQNRSTSRAARAAEPQAVRRTGHDSIVGNHLFDGISA